MPDYDWSKVKAEYIRGGASYRKLAEKYGVSFGTLRKVAAREKWTDLRNRVVAKKDTKLIESVSSREAKRVDLFENITDMLLDKIQAGIADGSLLATSRGMRDITGALKDIRDIKGIKSEADMKEQEARINKLIKDAERPDENINNEIKVILSSDLEDYAK